MTAGNCHAVNDEKKIADMMTARQIFKEWAESTPDEDEQLRKEAMEFKTRNHIMLTYVHINERDFLGTLLLSSVGEDAAQGRFLVYNN